jgi:hypothetical protein
MSACRNFPCTKELTRGVDGKVEERVARHIIEIKSEGNIVNKHECSSSYLAPGRSQITCICVGVERN